MKTDSIHYWLYAVIRKNFGSGPVLTRSWLAQRYSVNKHDFTITNIEPVGFFQYLSALLVTAGWVRDRTNSWEKDYGDFTGHISFIVGKHDISVAIFGYPKKKNANPRATRSRN